MPASRPARAGGRLAGPPALRLVAGAALVYAYRLMDPDKRALVLALLPVDSPLRAAYLDVRRRGWTPLMQAIVDGDEDAAARAIAAGVDVDAIAEGAKSALILACAAGHEGIVGRLLAAGADPNVLTTDDTTALHYAAAHAPGLVRRLLDAGARVATDRKGVSPLVAAIEEDRLDNLALLIDALPARDRSLGSEFEYACGRGRLDVMRQLCERHGHRLARDSNTALVAAVLGDQLEAVRFVLDAGVAIDEYDLKDEWSALMHAANAGHHEVAELLLARGADPNEQTEWFVTAPRIALQRGDARMFALLRAHGADEPDPPGDYTLSVVEEARQSRAREEAEFADALATDDVVAFAALVDAGKHSRDPLEQAARAGAVHTAAYLLARGVNPRAGRPSPLEVAIAAGAGHVVRMMLAARPAPLTDEIAVTAVNQADPWLLADLLAAGVSARSRLYGTTVIESAASAGRWRHVELLLDHGATLDDDINGECPLSRAAARGHVRCVEVLAAREPADRVVKSESHWPRPHTGMRRLDHALLEAARHPRTIEVLIRHGADPEVRDRVGDSLLHRGARSAASIELHLRLAGKYLDTPGRLGWTPLHNAAMASTPAAIATLVGAGARIDARDTDGRTPLHLVATYPNIGALEALLGAGADPHARDSEGRTPLQCAEARLANSRDDAPLAETVERLRRLSRPAP